MLKINSRKKIEVRRSIDYKKKYFDLLKQKEKAFITEEKDSAADGSDYDEEEYINFILIVHTEEQQASSSTSQVLTTTIFELTKDECNY